MPDLATQRAAAIADVKSDVAPTLPPTLSDPDVETIVDRCRRATIWLPATAYEIADEIVLNPRNGRKYTCIANGTSGATQPDFPVSRAAIISDGAGDLRWQESGPDFRNVFDIRLAKHLCWKLKAERFAHLHDLRQANTDSKESQTYQHFLEEAERWAPISL